MTVTATLAKAIKVSKPKHIYATPWVSGAKGTKTYDFSEILKDSTKITQADNTTNKIENEVSDTPIKTNVTLGDITFETTVEDIQADLMVSFAGFTKDSTSNKVYAPSSYSDLFAEIAVVLDGGDGKYVAYILPKVQLSTKSLLESLSSSMAGISLTGTALLADVTDGSNKYTTARYIDYDYTLPA